jgi:cardiolipin synthase C
MLTDLARDGVAVRMMTNALEATDVLPVHSGWIRYRGDLVEAGVTILELRARPDWEPGDRTGELFAGSGASLHAKTLGVDEARIFIGSFNFDPRAAALNTEMGVLIESPSIAAALAEALDRRDIVYEVRLGQDGRLEWLELGAGGEEIVHRTEPNTTIVQRGLVRFLSWLPIERFL